MAELNADSRAGFSGDGHASSLAGPAADGRPRPGSRAAAAPRLGAAGLAPLAPGQARGWVLVAPAGVPAAALAPLAALLRALGSPRRLLASSLGAGAPFADPGAASGAAGLAQSSRNAADSAWAGGADAWTQPQRLLAGLAEVPDPWLWPLAGDPGAFLGGQGSWAEALGAWRQPTLLLVQAAAVATGPAAAYHALLQRQGVPLLGLIQWGGPWQAAGRRCDGLPWLGWLADPQHPDPDQDLAEEATADLARALQLASHQLDLD